MKNPSKLSYKELLELACDELKKKKEDKKYKIPYSFINRKSLGLKYKYGNIAEGWDKTKFYIDFTGNYIEDLSLNEVLLIKRARLYTPEQVEFPQYWGNQGVEDVHSMLEDLCSKKYIHRGKKKSDCYTITKKGQSVLKSIEFITYLQDYRQFIISDIDYEQIAFMDFQRHPELKIGFKEQLFDIYQNNILCHMIYSDQVTFGLNRGYYVKMMIKMNEKRNLFESYAHIRSYAKDYGKKLNLSEDEIFEMHEYIPNKLDELWELKEKIN